MTFGDIPNSADKLIMNAIVAARKSWHEWQDVLKHSRSIATNPLLTNENRFAVFLKGFSVARTIRSGTRDRLRRQLIKELPAVLHDDTGQALDKLHGELCPHYGTCNGRRGFISALSKVAAFVRPERFIARDSYSMKGLNIIRGRSASTPFKSYADYLQEFDSAWESHVGQQARRLIRMGSQSSDEREPSFMRRVFDIYLMQCGDTKRKLVLIKGQDCHLGR